MLSVKYLNEISIENLLSHKVLQLNSYSYGHEVIRKYKNMRYWEEIQKTYNPASAFLSKDAVMADGGVPALWGNVIIRSSSSHGQCSRFWNSGCQQKPENLSSILQTHVRWKESTKCPLTSIRVLRHKCIHTIIKMFLSLDSGIAYFKETMK